MNLSSFGRRLLAAANGTGAGNIMGLGTAAFKNTGTSGNTVSLLDGANTWSAAQTFSAKPVLSGGAISFPATQVPSAGANDLDDYEEGSWTPGLTFATPGDLAVVYTNQTGKYVKVGSLVNFTFLVATSGFTYTTASSFFEITGFPFTIGNNFVGAGTLIMSGWTKANFTSLGLETSNSTFMYAIASGSGQVATELRTTDVPSGGDPRLYGSGFYSI